MRLALQKRLADAAEKALQEASVRAIEAPPHRRVVAVGIAAGGAGERAEAVFKATRG